MKLPKIFISYSHDSISHKEWVNKLGTRLRNNGIDAILDQWELKPGDDLPYFMETHLSDSDYILMICTEDYVKKANLGKGGVGYEKMIITSNLLKTIDENKIIPIIKQEASSEIPTFLKTKLYIDFSKKSDYEYNFDELIRTIHRSPLLKKPEIGNNPFKNVDIPLYEKKSNDHIRVVMGSIVNNFEATSSEIIFYNDLVYEVGISRIYLDLTLKELHNLQYIGRTTQGNVTLTEVGKNYAIINNLVNKN